MSVARQYHVDDPAQGELPLPGSMMSVHNQEKLVPKKTKPANDQKPKPHYSDGGDKDQTIPI